MGTEGDCILATELFELAWSCFLGGSRSHFARSVTNDGTCIHLPVARKTNHWLGTFGPEQSTGWEHSVQNMTQTPFAKESALGSEEARITRKRTV